MRILMLGPDRGGLASFIRAGDDTVEQTEAAVTSADTRLADTDMIVSYGYRHVLSPAVIAVVGGRAVNLHCSLLPWNRGAHPNLWSFLEDTPKGVTIHVMDEGIDTGPIIVQMPVSMGLAETLRTSYDKLAGAMEELFRVWWPAIREWEFEALEQEAGGSTHAAGDLKRVQRLLIRGWDTPVAALRSLQAKDGSGTP